ncbi:MAG: hypothetical protein K1X88_04590 [Nannocystaceae bacterium]|nr:hypothetical protein [Nannocystaceae bacterium]
MHAPAVVDDAAAPDATAPSPEPTSTATAPADASPDDASPDAASPDATTGRDASDDASASPEPTPAAAKRSPSPRKPAVPTPEPAAKDDEDDEALPQAMTRMEATGWWVLFGGVAVGTLAGVLAGLAERQEDRALRLSVRYDLETGEQPRYADVQREYEDTLQKGRAQAGGALALAIIGASAIVAGITITAVGRARAVRAAKGKQAHRFDLRGGSLAVRF